MVRCWIEMHALNTCGLKLLMHWLLLLRAEAQLNVCFRSVGAEKNKSLRLRWGRKKKLSDFRDGKKDKLSVYHTPSVLRR